MDQPDRHRREPSTFDAAERSARRAETEARIATVRRNWRIFWLWVPLVIVGVLLACRDTPGMPWVILAGFGIFGLLFAKANYNHLTEVRRLAEMLRVGARLDLDYKEYLRVEDFNESYGTCSLLEIGQLQQFRHVLAGQIGEQVVCSVDWSYSLGGNRHKRGYAQTLVVLRGPLGLPPFRLVPKGESDQFDEADIDFVDSPQFSKMYLLKGPDEAAIRAVFNPEVRARLERHANWHIEGHEAGLVAFRKNHQVAPDQLAEFIAEVMGLAALMAAPPPSPGS